VGLVERVMMSGGVAKNIGVVRALESQLGTTLLIPEEPQLVGALGAALIALEKSVSHEQSKEKV
jgi:activator of 2-hydroxyglutaryl-CoA dehydratase